MVWILEGTIRATIDLIQQLAWIGTAFRLSSKDRAENSKLVMKNNTTTDSGLRLEFNFENEPIPDDPHMCWYQLFRNPVIACGFPVPDKANEEKGLEMSLELMAALSGARFAIDFEGGLVMKGLSVLLLPVKQSSDVVQWHMISTPEGKRIKYEEARSFRGRALLHEVNHKSIQGTRAILGWWSTKVTNLGSQDAKYSDLDWSEACQIGRSVSLAGATFGFSKIFTAQVSFSTSGKDGRLRVPHSGPFTTVLRWAERQTAILYDYTDRRAWFVTALDVVMHVLHARQHLTPYQFRDEHVVLPASIAGKHGSSLRESLLANASKITLEKTSSDKPNFSLEDAILNIWALLERLSEKEEAEDAAPGLELRTTVKTPLYGWEFMDLLNESNFRHKQTMIPRKHGGWVDLANDSGSIVLFGSGFGEVIEPLLAGGSLCRKWSKLPIGEDYIAVECSTLETLYQEAGSRKTRKYLSSTHLQWRRQGMLFGRCFQRIH